MRSTLVRVVDEAGKAVGVMKHTAAVKLAHARGLVLVTVAPEAIPPVCKIMSLRQFQQWQRRLPKPRDFSRPRAVALRAAMSGSELAAKINRARGLLSKGFRVAFSIRNGAGAPELLDDAVRRLADHATIDSRASRHAHVLRVVFKAKA